MKRRWIIFLLAVGSLFIFSTLFPPVQQAQEKFLRPPALGTYENIDVGLSGNVTLLPSSPPLNAGSTTATAIGNFEGTLSVDPQTGIVRVTNARPAGTFDVRVRAFGSGRTASSTFKLTVITPPACAFDPPMFPQQLATLNVGERPAELATGDFDGDGKQDIAVTHIETNYVSIIRRNTANAGFDAAVNYDIGPGGGEIVAADFNGDGKQDLAIAQTSSIGLSLLIRNDTNTGFDLVRPFGTTEAPNFYSIALGDLNGDGKSDLILGTVQRNDLTVLLRNAANDGFDAPVIVDSGVNPISLVISDFNGDGKADVGIVSAGLTVLLRNPANTGFSLETGYPFATRPGALAAGDFNGDGKQDIVVSFPRNPPNPNVAWVFLRKNENDGFEEPTEYRSDDAYALAIGDFDRDGKSDILATNYEKSRISLLLRNSANTDFKPAVYFPAGAQPHSVALGDFDGDGKQDFVVANSVDRKVSVQMAACSRGRTAFDYDGDGRSDVSVFRPSNGTWHVQRSDLGPQTSAFGLSADRVTPEDYDGDGKTDLAVYRPDEGVWYRLNSSNGTFAVVRFGAAEDLPTPADYDGDGRADISVFRPSEGTWYRLNSSDGLFAGLQWGMNGDKPALGDYDGDGKADVCVFRPSNGYWHLISSGTGAISSTSFGLPNDISTPADFDGDGRTDIAVYRPATGTWWRINSRTWTMHHSIVGNATDIPVAADFDGDGRADVSVFRPDIGDWYRLDSGNDAFVAKQLGISGDKPTQSAYTY